MFIGTSYRRGFLTVLLGLASTVVPGTIASANYISYEYIADLGSGTSVPQFSLSPAYATLFSVTLSITSIADVVGYSEWENDSQVGGHATINILPNVTVSTDLGDEAYGYLSSQCSPVAVDAEFSPAHINPHTGFVTPSTATVSVSGAITYSTSDLMEDWQMSPWIGPGTVGIDVYRTPSSYVSSQDPGLSLQDDADWEPSGEVYGFVTYSYDLVVPEPSTFVLLFVGAVSLLAYGWRKRRQACGIVS